MKPLREDKHDNEVNASYANVFNANFPQSRQVASNMQSRGIAVTYSSSESEEESPSNRNTMQHIPSLKAMAMHDQAADAD